MHLKPFAQKLTAGALLLMFFTVEYLHFLSLDSLGPYALYVFELTWVAVAWMVFRGMPLLPDVPKEGAMVRASGWRKLGWFAAVVLLPLGWGVHRYAQGAELLIPFDFSSTETLVLLLTVGPVLEELLYRGAIWRLFEILFEGMGQRTWMIVLATSLLFSFSHYHAVFSVPEEFQGFIRFQTLYTLGLGWAGALLRVKAGLSGSILGHVCFNVGFWLGRA